VFLDHYNHIHRHAGIGLHMPTSVHYGNAGEIRAYGPPSTPTPPTTAASGTGHPSPPKLPTVAWINEPTPEAPSDPHEKKSSHGP
jgi:putative transposase